jgi:cellulose synthase/poly-beta-1,6-N-acetylglucosamine synthase-like glycosyltransferase
MYELEIKILKIASKAVKDAQKDSLKRGIANVYSKNKKLYFQLPDGTITQEKPKQYNFCRDAKNLASVRIHTWPLNA